MPLKATNTWMKSNFVGILVGCLGLIGTFITLNSKVDILVSKVENHTQYISRVQKLERDFIQVKATQDASKQYWIRFESLLKSNTSALNANSAVMSGVNIQLKEHARRIGKLEDDKD